MDIFGALHAGFGDSVVNMLTQPDEAATFSKARSVIHFIRSTQAEFGSSRLQATSYLLQQYSSSRHRH